MLTLDDQMWQMWEEWDLNELEDHDRDRILTVFLAGAASMVAICHSALEEGRMSQDLLKYLSADCLTKLSEVSLQVPLRNYQ